MSVLRDPNTYTITTDDGPLTRKRMAEELRYVADLIEHGAERESGGIYISGTGTGCLSITSDLVLKTPWMAPKAPEVAAMADEANFTPLSRPGASECPCCYDCATPWQRASWMILCPICRNKRCPKANNHANECTDSNEPGQPGSRY